MRDTSKDDKIHGNRNTYGFERGDELFHREYKVPVLVLRAYKYTCLLRSLVTGNKFIEFNWALISK